MEKLQKIFKQHNGYCRMKELKAIGIQTRDVAKAVNQGIIEKIKPGLYKIVEYAWDENSSFVDIAKAKSSAVICLISALDYHELTTINPSKITVAVPMNTDKFKLKYPPISVYYFSENLYNLGIINIKTKIGNFKVYDPEKTICDMFRYRNKLGEDTALEGLKNYLKRRDANINTLWDYAIKCRVKTIIEPYLKAMVFS